MNGIINPNYRRQYINPYRHGVLIGNFVEDIYGTDLKEKQSQETVNQKNFISEHTDQFSWPQIKTEHFKNPGNDLTKQFNVNFDFNIDFTTKNMEDYMKLQGANEYQLEDKNSFLSSQIKADKTAKKQLEGSGSNIHSETQNMLKGFHEKDTSGRLYTKKSGLVKDLFFGHGLDQSKFDKSEYASTYQ